MARLGNGELRQIVNKILKELYHIAKEQHNQRKAEIAKQNREYFMEPLLDKLAEIPSQLLQNNPTYQLFIKYKVDPTNAHAGIDDVWEHTCKDAKAVNPTLSYGYTNRPTTGNLDTRLEEVTAVLCEEIIDLRTEEQEMSQFLIDSTNRYKGTIQLRKVWPPSLHKYLPVEVKRTRAPRTKQEKIGSPDPVAPLSIKSRMTSNLLEDN
tara:strand:- start:4007 stop:4630 length:624 start_codon:yes stop_codon:yes gene_type:complete